MSLPTYESCLLSNRPCVNGLDMQLYPCDKIIFNDTSHLPKIHMFVVCYMLNIVSLLSSYNKFFGRGGMWRDLWRGRIIIRWKMKVRGMILKRGCHLDALGGNDRGEPAVSYK